MSYSQFRDSGYIDSSSAATALNDSTHHRFLFVKPTVVDATATVGNPSASLRGSVPNDSCTVYSSSRTVRHLLNQ